MRPSHTYDRTLVPLDGGWTASTGCARASEVVVHGDGTSLWTLTHHADFARGFVPLLGHPRAIGEAFHITSDDVLTWNQIAEALAAAAGVDGRASCTCRPTRSPPPTRSGAPACSATRRTRWSSTTQAARRGAGLRGAIPFEQGAREIVAWYDADPARQVVDERLDAALDKLVETWDPQRR